MNMKYDMAKLAVGMGNVCYILCKSLAGGKKTGYGWCGIAIGILLVFMVIKSVSFMKGQESTWVVLVLTIVTMPFNIKIAFIVVGLYLDDGFILAKFFGGMAVYLCILSMEEILFGVMARIMWPIQNETFLYAINKLKEKMI